MPGCPITLPAPELRPAQRRRRLSDQHAGLDQGIGVGGATVKARPLAIHGEQFQLYMVSSGLLGVVDRDQPHRDGPLMPFALAAVNPSRQTGGVGLPELAGGRPFAAPPVAITMSRSVPPTRSTNANSMTDATAERHAVANGHRTFSMTMFSIYKHSNTSY